MGPLESVTGSVAQFAPRTKTVDGKDCAPSEVDDWSSMIGKFKSGATGVWEGSTLMKVGAGWPWLGCLRVLSRCCWVWCRGITFRASGRSGRR